MKLPIWLAAPCIRIFYRLWCSSLRIRQYGRQGLEELTASGHLAVVSIWHDELFTLIHKRGNLKLLTVVSQSRDGQYLASLLEALGIGCVRGSSSRGGLGALLKAVRIMREEGRHTVITIDGPRGPRHRAKQGALILAHRTPALIQPIRLFPHKALLFKSWDRFQLPLPFSRVDIVFGEAYSPQLPDLSEESLKEACLELEKRLGDIKKPLADDGDCKSLGLISFKEILKGWHLAARAAMDRAFSGLQRPVNDVINGLKLALLRRLATLMARVPWKVLRRLADCLGLACWLLLRSRRELASEAVARHLRLGPAEARRIARQSFKENFLSFLEIFHSVHFVTESSVRVLHSPEVKALLQAESGPVVITTAHIGSWELMPGLAADLLPDREGLVVVRSQKNRLLQTVMAELRGARGMRVLGHREAAPAVVTGLRKGGMAAFLVDHNCSRKEAVFLPFLEDTAAVNSGPASLALRAKAALYPVFLVRDGQGGHILHMLPPLYTAKLEGNVSERVRQIAGFYTQAVEEMVRLYPEQWFWMHKRWKTREK